MKASVAGLGEAKNCWCAKLLTWGGAPGWYDGAPLALENGIGNEVLIDDGRDDEKINSAANALSCGRTG